jgi:hypothetical protein
VSLQCWSTTPDERDPTPKIPDQSRFIGGTTFQDTRDARFCAVGLYWVRILYRVWKVHLRPL